MVRRKRRENKGFSLLEVVIAVAVLTILMAPIITQIMQTLSVSAAAKERQYAIENAEYVLNTVQETPIARMQVLTKDLTSAPGTSAHETLGDVVFTGVTDSDKTVKCHILTHVYADLDEYLARVQTTETDLASMTTLETYPYHVSDYSLEQAKLGKKKNSYSRRIIVDNMRAKIAENELSVETNFTDGAIAYLKAQGYTITTEGAAVKYLNGVVTDVICSKVTGLKSPNGAGTSYMQDLDSSKVAIIQGAASNFDLQAENDLYNLKMNRLKKERPGDWAQAMTHVSSGEGDITNILKTNLYLDNVSKMTKISIVSGYETRDSKKVKYYDVDCVVYYEDYLTKSATTGSTSASAGTQVPELLSYNAYSRRFYTSQAPDVYFVYEPYVADGSNYARKDYILTYDGVIYDAGEKHSKLYIVKPNTCRIGGYATNTSTFRTKMKTSSTDGDPVEIYVDYLKVNGSTNEPMPIYTNIDITNNYFKNNTISEGNANGVQYKDNLGIYYAEPKSSDLGEVDKSVLYAYGTEITRENYPEKITYDGKLIDSIQDITKDVMLSDRIYTVTVQLDKLKEDNSVDEGNSIRLSGAKGAD